jgi:hypothetical protein
MLTVLAVLIGERAVVSTLAGGVDGTQGAYADASGTNAGFYNIFGVAIDASGNVFVADRDNQRIRKVTAGGGTRIDRVALRAGCADSDVAALTLLWRGADVPTFVLILSFHFIFRLIEDNLFDFLEYDV